jgi:transcriptional regulator with XRE-family HTH domain
LVHGLVPFIVYEAQSNVMATRKPGTSATQHKLEVGTRLKLIIQASGLSVTDWAKKYGRKKQNVTEWVKGRSYPDIEVLIRVCENEALTLDWFFRNIEAGISKAWADRLSQPKPASQAVSRELEPPVHGKS